MSEKWTVGVADAICQRNCLREALERLTDACAEIMGAASASLNGRIFLRKITL
jgi:hypothetical protein